MQCKPHRIDLSNFEQRKNVRCKMQLALGTHQTQLNRGIPIATPHSLPAPLSPTICLSLALSEIPKLAPPTAHQPNKPTRAACEIPEREKERERSRERVGKVDGEWGECELSQKQYSSRRQQTFECIVDICDHRQTFLCFFLPSLPLLLPLVNQTVRQISNFLPIHLPLLYVIASFVLPHSNRSICFVASGEEAKKK